MHAVAAHNSNIHSVLDYHDEKLQDSRAQYIYGANFIRDPDRLNRQEKLYHFQRLMTLNPKIRRNVLHFVLRFGWREQVSNETMAQVAREYMERMGLGKQPYLVYRHFDTPVPHAHIVSTNVGPDGKRIGFTKADLRKSRELTRDLETKYSLQPDSIAMAARTDRQRTEKVRYGQMPLYPSMSAVLDAVIPNYQYTNLGELNAVLATYNMRASRGSERSVTRQKNGLHYLSLNDNGRPTGAYIPSSAFRIRPTWKDLQSRFSVNAALREPNRRRVATAIDFALAGRQLGFMALQQALARDKIAIVFERDPSGALQKLWYIDHHTRSVFGDKALGDKYLAAAIRERTISEETYRQRLTLNQTQQPEHRMRPKL